MLHTCLIWLIHNATTQEVGRLPYRRKQVSTASTIFAFRVKGSTPYLEFFQCFSKLEESDVDRRACDLYILVIAKRSVNRFSKKQLPTTPGNIKHTHRLVLFFAHPTDWRHGTHTAPPEVFSYGVSTQKVPGKSLHQNKSWIAPCRNLSNWSVAEVPLQSVHFAHNRLRTHLFWSPSPNIFSATNLIARPRKRWTREYARHFYEGMQHAVKESLLDLSKTRSSQIEEKWKMPLLGTLTP